MVNIIMPAYNGHKTIRQAIASVFMQDNINDIKLTIVDDDSEEPYDYLLEEFKYININILKKPFNSGCGQSRQYGIDHTDCEYFMFLDVDDCLYSAASVKNLLSTIKKENCDLVSSIFLEETTQSDGYIFHEKNLVWMHGKIYRTKYIKDNNIHFNETRANEDHAFNMILFNNDAKIFYGDFVTYIWKNNKNSLTRSGDYLADGINDFIINAEFSLMESIRLKSSNEKLCDCVLQYLISLYGYFLIFIKNQKEKAFISAYILNVKRFYKNIPCELKKSITEKNLERLFYHNSLIDIVISANIIMNMSIYDFINMINN